MRYLLISLCLLMVGCSSYPKKNNFVVDEINAPKILNTYFSDTIDYVYKAQISVRENNFGGILIIKKINMNSHRVVFATEMGNTLFDFSYVGDDFKVLIEDNPERLNSYRNNENQIFNAEIYKKDYFYFYNENSLVKIINAKNGKENISFIFSDIDDDIAKNVLILHNKIKLKIRLTKI